MKNSVLIFVGIVIGSLLLGVGAYFGFHTSPKTSIAGSTISQQYGTPFQATDAYTGSGQASTTEAAVSGKTYYLTDISGSAGTGGGTVVVEDGSTIIWEAYIASSTPYDHAFVQPIKTTAGNSLYVFTTGSVSEVINSSGYSYP